MRCAHRPRRADPEQADTLSALSGRPVTRNEVSRWEAERRLLTPFWQQHFADSFDMDGRVLRDAVAASRAARRRAKGDDGTEVEIMAGRCWTELRRPLRAVPVLERVLGDFDDTCARDKALYLTWLATAYLQAHEVDQAAVTLRRAHELAVGVASTRPGTRIAAVARKLDRHRDVPEVGQVLDELRA